MFFSKKIKMIKNENCTGQHRGKHRKKYILLYTPQLYAHIIHHVNTISAEIMKVLHVYFDTETLFNTGPQDQAIKQDPP